MGFGATNIQCLKEKIMKMVKTEGHFGVAIQPMINCEDDDDEVLYRNGMM